MGADGPKFEVASVKRAERCEFGSSIDPGSVTLRGMPLKPVLMEAFKVKMEQIQGPPWLDADCFEIIAKTPKGATSDQRPAMFRELLTERFKLAAHKENRLRRGYALVVDKGGPKFKEDDPNKSFMEDHPGQTFFGSGGKGRLRSVMTMAFLAAYLSKRGYGPVEDLTGLKGKYDIELTWTPDPDFEPKGFDVSPSTAPPQSADSPAEREPDLFVALRESLGLKLEGRNVPVEIVVIDHIERVPTEN